ncbi:MAG: hypothetical protein LHV69_02770 [Elusimicrobia bacterium]|nr:hypothetical protein [Candidatus Obscuribacterium magneticum]
MKKRIRVGSDFYRNKKLKTITVHVSPKAHQKLRLMAAREDRSFQKTIRRILEEFTEKLKPE